MIQLVRWNLCCMQDLCERHEKGVVTEHQKTIQKLNQYKKKGVTVPHSHSSVSTAVLF